MRKKRVFWVRLSSSLISGVILGVGLLGLLLSWQPVNPVIVVSGGRIGTMLRILMEMLDFVHLGI